LSGKVTDDAKSLAILAADIARLALSGVQVVVVHGGGKQLDALAARLNIPVVAHEGRRVTDTATLELAKMVFAGQINTNVTAALLAAGLSPVGISGVSGGLVRAERRSPVPIDFGHVGNVTGVDTSLIEALLADDRVPVVSCLGVTPSGEVLNINADTVAAALAVALKADQAYLVSDVDGIYAKAGDAATRLPRLDLAAAKDLLASGDVTGGMRPKLKAVIDLVEAGLASVHVLSGGTPLLRATIADGKHGTTITRHL
jgi:acetylglutamate kinase